MTQKILLPGLHHWKANTYGQELKIIATINAFLRFPCIANNVECNMVSQIVKQHILFLMLGLKMMQYDPFFLCIQYSCLHDKWLMRLVQSFLSVSKKLLQQSTAYRNYCGLIASDTNTNVSELVFASFYNFYKPSNFFCQTQKWVWLKLDFSIIHIKTFHANDK